jgi:hypothetical protein
MAQVLASQRTRAPGEEEDVTELTGPDSSESAGQPRFRAQNREMPRTEARRHFCAQLTL